MSYILKVAPVSTFLMHKNAVFLKFTRNPKKTYILKYLYIIHIFSSDFNICVVQGEIFPFEYAFNEFDIHIRFLLNFIPEIYF